MLVEPPKLRHNPLIFLTESPSMLFALLLTATLPAPQEAQAPTPKAEKICKGRVNTGSRLRSKPVCKTQAEWDAEAATNADSTRNMGQTQSR